MRLCASAAQTPWRHGIPAGSPGRMLRIRAACSRRRRPSAAAAAAAVMRANGLWDEDLNCAKDGAAVTFDQYLAAALHARVAYKEVPLERSRARPPLPLPPFPAARAWPGFERPRFCSATNAAVLFGQYLTAQFQPGPFTPPAPERSQKSL